MTAVRLCPKSEVSSFVFAELGVREKYLEELYFDQERSTTTLIKDLDLYIAHVPDALGSLGG